MTHFKWRRYLSFQGVDDIKRCNGLSFCVFSVCNSITNDTLKEDFKDTASLSSTLLFVGLENYFFVDETGDTFNTATTSETTDGRFRDTLYNTILAI